MKKWSIEISEYTNCCCSICFRLGRVAKIKYYTQNYASNKRKGKICKRLQKHPHSIWICEKCMDDFRREWTGHTRGLGFAVADFYQPKNGEWIEKEAEGDEE